MGNPVLISARGMAYDIEGLADEARQHRNAESARLAPTSIRQLSVGNPILISGREMAYDIEGLADEARQLMLGGE